MISQDSDLETLFLDSFLTIANVSDEDIASVLNKLNDISERFDTNFTISISMDADFLPEDCKKDIVISL